MASSPDLQVDMATTANDFAKKDYVGAAISIAAMAIPGVPAPVLKGAKNAVKKSVKAVSKSKVVKKAVKSVKNTVFNYTIKQYKVYP